MEAPLHEPGVLEDASGKRARWMRRAGRLVFVFFLAWLTAILLGGLGLAPVPSIPFTHSLRPSHGPAPVKLPPPAPTPAADLVPALPVSVVPLPVIHGRSSTAPGQTKTTATTTTHGRSSTAPGHTKTTTTHGRSTTSPGHTKTTTTTTTVHGKKKTTP